jgi:hypothetical protein
MYTAKYIQTRNGSIIVFSAAIKHNEFLSFDPVSAGFISIGVDKEGNPTCSCYGRSESLKLNSREEEDTRKAKTQIIL